MGGELLWTCCGCGNGVMTVAVNASCHECVHERCSNCQLDSTEYNKFDVIPTLQAGIQSNLAQTFENPIKRNTTALEKEYSASNKDYSTFAQDNPGYSKRHSTSNRGYSPSRIADYSSALALRPKRSDPSPGEPEDGMYDYDDSVQTQPAKYMSTEAYDPPECPDEKEESLETSSTSGSDDTEITVPYEGPLIFLNSRALNLILDAYQHFRSPQETQENNDNEATPSDEGPADNGSDGAASSEGQSSHSSRPKRKNADRDEDDEGSGKRRRNGQRGMSFVHDSGERLFLACPFYKFNSREHRHCCISKLRTITRVKYVYADQSSSCHLLLTLSRQHLDRCHQPPIHCSSCFREFKTEERRIEHSRVRPSCTVVPVKTWNAVNTAQKQRLKARFSSKKSPEENWYIMFDILFPDAPRPRSPCK
jgi:hypothetical protein